MKKFFLTTASLLTMVSIMGVAQVGVTAAKPSKPTHASARALSQAQTRALIQAGKLKPVTAKQAAKLNAQVKRARTMGRKSDALARTARTSSDYCLSAYSYDYYYYVYYYGTWYYGGWYGPSYGIPGSYYYGRYQEQGRLWYDETYDYYYGSSNYSYYYFYKDWLVCTAGY